MRVSWHSFDLKSGRRGPRVKVRALEKAEQVLSTATSTSLQVLMWNETTQGPVPGWESASNPGQVILAAIDEETDGILWGGYATGRNANVGMWANVSVSSMEGYFDRRFTTDHTFTGDEQADIFDALVTDAAVNGPPFVVDCPATGILRDRTYLSTEDKTVLSALQELAGVEQGIEFTTNLEWTDETHTAIQVVARGAMRLGYAASTPPVVFTLPGNVTDFDYAEDYSSEHGANEVMAVSSGEGDTRPQSSVQSSRPPTQVAFERRVSPSTSITSVATLNAHAVAELGQTWDGLKELKVTGRLDQVPHPSTWSIGDNIAVSLTCPRFPAVIDSAGIRQPGFEKVIRCIGREIDFDNLAVTPRLVEITEAP